MREIFLSRYIHCLLKIGTGKDGAELLFEIKRRCFEAQGAKKRSCLV